MNNYREDEDGWWMNEDRREPCTDDSSQLRTARTIRITTTILQETKQPFRTSGRRAINHRRQRAATSPDDLAQSKHHRWPPAAHPLQHAEDNPCRRAATKPTAPRRASQRTTQRNRHLSSAFTDVTTSTRLRMTKLQSRQANRHQRTGNQDSSQRLAAAAMPLSRIQPRDGWICGRGRPLDNRI